MRKLILSAVIVLVALVGALAWSADALVRHAARAALRHELGTAAAQASVGQWHWEDLGREVTLEDLVITEQPGGAAVLLRLSRVRVEVDAVRLVLSGGREVHLGRLEVEAPELLLHRTADGAWNVDPVLAALREMLARPESAATRPVVDSMTLRHGRVRVQDDVAGHTQVLEDVQLSARDLAPGRDLEVDVEMGLGQQNGRAPLKLHAWVQQLPVRWDPDQLPECRVHLRAGRVELAPWNFLLPPGAPRAEEGTLDADLEVQVHPAEQRVDARGPVEVQGLVLASQGQRGVSTALSLDVDVTVAGAAPAITVRRLDVRAPALSLKTRLELAEPAVTAVRDADIVFHVDSLARLQAVLPPGGALLPEGVVLEGPVDLRVQGDAQQGTVQVDLDGAHVAYGRWLDKPAGVPLHAGLALVRVEDKVRVRTLDAALDKVRITGSAEVPVDPTRALDVDVDTGAVSVMELQRVFPLVAEAVRVHGTVGGQVRMRAAADVVEGEQQLRGQVMLTGLDLRARAAQVRGNALVTVEVKPGPRRATALLSALLDDLELRVQDADGQVLLDKARRYPANVDVKVVYENARLALDDARLEVGSSKVVLRGGVSRLAYADAAVDVVAEALDVAFDDLRQLSPSAEVLPAGGHVSSRLRLTGNPREPHSLHLTGTDVDVRAGSSSVQGLLEVADFQDPVVQATVTSSSVRVDDVKHWETRLGLPAPARQALAQLPRGMHVQSRLLLGARLSQPETLLLKAENLRVTAGGSELVGSATLANGVDPRVEAQLDRLDLRFPELRTLGAPAALPPDGRLEGRARVRWHAGRPEDLDLAFQGMHSTAFQSDVVGTGTWRGLEEPEVDVTLSGPLLDLGATARGLRPEPTRGAPDLRRRLARARGKLRAVVDHVRYDAMQFDNLVAGLRLARGELVADRLSAGVLGGLVNADGARVELGSARPRVRVDLSVQGLDLERMSQVVLQDPGAYGGRLDITANLTAVGSRPEELRASLDGPFTVEAEEVRLRDFALYPRTLVATPDVRPIDPGADDEMRDDARPYFRSLSVAGRLEGRRITFTQPFMARSPFGDLALLGVIDVPDRMALSGSTTMAPETVARMTLGTVRPEERTLAPLQIGGTLARPVLERLDVSGFVQGTGPGQFLAAARVLAAAQAAGVARRLTQAQQEAQRVRAEASAQAAEEAARLRERLDRERDEALQQYEAQWGRQQSAAWRAAQQELRRLRRVSGASGSVDGGTADSGSAAPAQ